MKKLISLVLTLALLALSLGAALADTNNLTADNKISITGLVKGDVANFYQVLKFDQDAVATKGWVAAEGFTALTTDEIKYMLGIDLAEGQTGGISAAMGGKIGNMAKSATAKYSNVAADTDGKAEVATGVVPGLYVIIVTPTDADTVYNPVFVGADYAENTSNTWAINMAKTYSDQAMAKKDKVPLNKTAATTEATYEDNKPETVAVGDEITFTVTTTIPQFAANYTNPVFKVTDVLDTGLTFKTGSLTIAPEIAATNYTLTETDGGVGYVLDFKADYLKTLTAPVDITITYKATVNSAATYNVNEFDNTVTVNFSNNPSDTQGHGVLRDRTKHYTFSIDATLLGNPSYTASEVVKVGLDADGKELTETVTLSSDGEIGALQGAEFKLYTDAACNTPYSDTTYTSDQNGHITIKGLDAGTYYLKETNAPAGYIKQQDAAKVEIIAEIVEKEYTETVDGIDVTYKVNELKSYEIKIDGAQTAHASLTNSATGITTLTWDEFVGKFGLIGATEDPKAAYGKIKNTKGTELPSTGGIGTTIFYIVGGILLIGAAVILVARRKAQD